MAKLEIFIKRTNIKDIKMTQNGIGEYMYNGSGYANVAMKDFEATKSSPPRGYTLYSNGSHSKTNLEGVNVRAQRAVDISKLGIATATLGCTVTGLYRQGTASYVKVRFTNNKQVWFVHAANDYVKVGDVIKAGENIAECVGTHFHLFMTGEDIWSWYMKQYAPILKPGDRVKYTVNTNLRKEPGTGDKIGTIEAGAVGEVLGGPKYPDQYTWYYLRFGAGDTLIRGWAIEGTKTDEAVTNLDGSPIVEPDPCQEYKDEIVRLEQELQEKEAIIHGQKNIIEEQQDAILELQRKLDDIQDIIDNDDKSRTIAKLKTKHRKVLGAIAGAGFFLRYNQEEPKLVFDLARWVSNLLERSK